MRYVSALPDTWDSLSHVSESAETWLVVHLPPKADARSQLDMHIMNGLSFVN